MKKEDKAFYIGCILVLAFYVVSIKTSWFHFSYSTFVFGYLLGASIGLVYADKTR